MANGTILGGIFAARLHKSNAEDVREEAERMLAYYRNRLLILAAMAPMNVDEGDGPMPWDFYVRREIDGMWEEIQEQTITAWKAGYIVAEPGECKDELVDADWEGEDEQGE